MGNSPHKYVYSTTKNQKNNLLASYFGFWQARKKDKIKKNDTVLYIGSFDYSRLSSLPSSCKLFIIDVRGEESPHINDGNYKSFPSCLCVRSNRKDLVDIINDYLSCYNIEGNTWGEALETLKYFIERDFSDAGDCDPIFTIEYTNPNIMEERI